MDGVIPRERRRIKHSDAADSAHEDGCRILVVGGMPDGIRGAKIASYQRTYSRTMGPG